MKKPLVNIEQSIHQKLLNQAKSTNQTFEHVLKRYAMERFLYRLSVSPHASDFILKGGLLLTCYDVPSSRPTLDIDLQSFYPDHHLKRVQAVIHELCQLQVDPDGLRFDETNLVCETLNHLDGYEGVGVHFFCYLGRADIAVKIDIGFSGGLNPAPILVNYPTLLAMPSPRLRAYRQESVIAEKFEAMVKHDLATSRMKDFYDIWMLSSTFEYESTELSMAIKQIFKHCKREMEGNYSVLQEVFAADRRLAQKWQIFLQKNNLTDAPREFSTVMKHIRQFLQPIAEGIAKQVPIKGHWVPPEPWKFD